jgi:anti-sigma factor RsiW
MSAHADSYSLWDAAYVLGALSPAERREFEEHLAGCTGCQQSVAELVGLPGLLGQVSPEDAALLATQAQPAEGEAAPATLMPRVIGEQRTRRRRIVAAVAGAAAAMILILGGVAAGAGLLPPWQPRSPFLLAFSEVQPTSITAIVEVVPASEGTDFQVECQYGEANEPTPGGAYETYEIWIVDRSGTAVEAKAWPAHPNRVMRPQAHSPWKVSRISAVEIRSSDGETLLRADLR